MKSRVGSFLLIAAIASFVFSCGEDTSPEKTVGSITFVVTEENTPETLSGVSIQLFSDDDPSVTPTDRTDNSGRCTFSNIPLGSYHMSLSKPGYESKEGLTVRIKGGDNPNKEIALKKTATELTVSPTTLDFGDNASVVQKAFSLVNPNYVDLEWSVQDTNVKWLVSVCDKNGKSYGTIEYNEEVAMSVTIDRSKLTVGNNESTIVILSDYGRAELKVKAVGTPDPSVYMSSVSSIGFEDALLTGEIVEEGVPAYRECGFVVGEKSGPTVNNNLQSFSFPASSSSTFRQTVKDLVPEKKYYVRAFAKNEKDIYYSNELDFMTQTPEKPVVLTLTAIKIHESGAKIRAYVQSTGHPAFTKKGFVISSTNNQPTLDNSKGWTISGAQTGDYSLILTNCIENATYYVRAFAITPYDTVYFNVTKFTPIKPYIAIGNLGVRIEDDYDEYGEYKMSSYEAKKTCNNLVLGKYDDWRLPTSEELLLIYSHRSEIGCFSSDKYWTATRNKELPDWESGAWNEGWVAIDFATGETNTNNPYVSYSYRVRAVRSLQ